MLISTNRASKSLLSLICHKMKRGMYDFRGLRFRGTCTASLIHIYIMIGLQASKANKDMAAAITTAVLADPKAFADAAKTTVEAMGGAIDNAGKAIDALTKARGFISSMTTKHAYVINLSAVECTWYCYNDAAPIKWTTQFQSHMGAYSTVTCHTLGTGAMSLFKNNNNPPYTVQRGKAYYFDGKNLSLIYSAPQ